MQSFCCKCARCSLLRRQELRMGQAMSDPADSVWPAIIGQCQQERRCDTEEQRDGREQRSMSRDATQKRSETRENSTARTAMPHRGAARRERTAQHERRCDTQEQRDGREKRSTSRDATHRSSETGENSAARAAMLHTGAARRERTAQHEPRCDTEAAKPDSSQGTPERLRRGLAWGAVGQPGGADGPAEDWVDSMVQALLPVTEAEGGRGA